MSTIKKNKSYDHKAILWVISAVSNDYMDKLVFDFFLKSREW